MSDRRRPTTWRGRTATATRVLAHRLLHRACRRGDEPDLDAALRLVDERLVPAAEARRAVAAEALDLALAALAERRPGGRLEGELRADVRVALPRHDGSSRVVLIPSLILHRGAVSVLTVQDGDAETAERRARRYRRAARVLLERPVRAFVVRSDGALDELPPSA